MSLVRAMGFKARHRISKQRWIDMLLELATLGWNLPRYDHVAAKIHSLAPLWRPFENGLAGDPFTIVTSHLSNLPPDVVKGIHAQGGEVTARWIGGKFNFIT